MSEPTRLDPTAYFLTGFNPGGKLQRKFAKASRNVRIARWAVAREVRRTMTGVPGLFEIDPLRISWFLMLGHWCGRGFFRYEELRDEARRWAVEHPTPVPPTVPDDVESWDEERLKALRIVLDRWDRAHLREPLSAHLTAVAGARSKPERARRRSEFRSQLLEGRCVQAMRTLVREGVCPVCCKDVAASDVCGHGYHGARVAGDGTIEVPRAPSVEDLVRERVLAGTAS